MARAFVRPNTLQRQQIITLRREGWSYGLIQKEMRKGGLDISRKSVYLIAASGRITPLPRSGRPKALTDRQKRQVISIVRRQPSITRNEMRNATGIINLFNFFIY